MLETLKFSRLKLADLFLSQNGCMYRKVSEREGELLRYSIGEEPTERTEPEFDPDMEVELIPPRE